MAIVAKLQKRCERRIEMNDFIGGNYYNQAQEQQKTKKTMKLIIILIVLLLMVCIGLVGFMYYIKMVQLKITVDEKNVADLENVFIFENEKIYVPIRAFASYVGYSSSNGDYTQDKYTEDATKCYVESKNEVANFSLGSNKIYKIVLDGENNYEYYEIDEPIRMINNQLCTTIQGAQTAFNISMAYTKQENRITIYTLPYLVNYYTANKSNAAIAKGNDVFSNQKALLHNMIIVKDNSNDYGVYSLDGKEILGIKYKAIKFIESTMEFIVTTQENKMGIMSYTSETKISPQYDAIKQIDKNNGLYLVTNNKKQGVINDHGSIVIYIEYDQIGINASQFANNDIQNQYLLYNKCIPVKQNGKWGLFDKTGKQLTQLQYDDFGCTEGGGSSIANSNKVLLIPKYEAIVVKQEEFYGLIDSQGKAILPSVLKSMYSTTASGEVTYFMIYNEQVMNIIDYIETYVKGNNQTNSGQENENSQTGNVNSNEVQNNTDGNNAEQNNEVTNNTQNNIATNTQV